MEAPIQAYTASQYNTTPQVNRLTSTVVDKYIEQENL